MRCFDLCNEAIQILGIYFLYRRRIKEERHCLKIVSNVQSVLKLAISKFALEGGIIVFKILGIWKIIFQALIEPFPTQAIKTLETIETSFLWNNSNLNIKHKNLCKIYECGVPRNDDVWNKVKKLYGCFHEWKIIPLYQLNKTFDSSFKFHSNVSFNKSSLKKQLAFLDIRGLAKANVFRDHLKLLLKYFLNFCGLTITWKLRVLQ